MSYVSYKEIEFDPETAPEAYLLSLMRNAFVSFRCCGEDTEKGSESFCCCTRSFPVVMFRDEEP